NNQIRSNNRYTDRNGNVYRKDGTNWFRENNQAMRQSGNLSGGKVSGERGRNVQKNPDHKNDMVRKRPSTNNIQQLQGSDRARTQGNKSHQNYQRSRPPSSGRPMKGGGGHR
ncbi:MAG: hypothetical protein KKA76_14730, partial [Proteobacteria bacterium]|nr:hypothetical protein [Pseudomonadota bacterium]